VTAPRTAREAAGAALPAPAPLRPAHSQLPAELSVARQPAHNRVDAELWAGLHLPGACSAAQLAQLAQLAQRFTPRVSLEPPDGLVLEVRGSLHLFAGLEGLSAALLKVCAQLALQPRLAFAPTPLAALVAARAGCALKVTARAQLLSQLSPLPLSALRWPPVLLERLQRVGVRSIGAALRLPRAGFARRFGAAQLTMLDKLTGRAPELRVHFQPRARFRRHQELPCEMESHAYLLAALAQPLRELEDFLSARQAGVMALECRLLHRQGAVTRCLLNLAAPAADARQLADLYAEKFSNLRLPQPVRALELRARRLLPLCPQARALWQPGEHGGGAGNEAHLLIERLRARLGEQAIHGLKLNDDHRPESTWVVAAPPTPAARAGQPGGVVLPARRPLWLLAAPQPLTVRAGLPRRRGALELLSEPERIESGWWDGLGIARDYYVARDVHAVRLWIYRERVAPHGWFLHGIFG
jgi:protein ImuB